MEYVTFNSRSLHQAGTSLRSVLGAYADSPAPVPSLRLGSSGGEDWMYDGEGVRVEGIGRTERSLAAIYDGSNPKKKESGRG